MGEALGIAQPQRVNFAQMMVGRYFVIPNYQRHFAWCDKQCQDLFEDCVLTARNPGLERFMSTVTVIAPAGEAAYRTYNDHNFAELRPLLVVDGQQRLTSIVILIATICQHMLRATPGDRAVRHAYSSFVRATLDDNRSMLRVIPQAIPDYPDLMRTQMDTVTALEPLLPVGHADPEIIIPAQRRIVAAHKVFDKGLHYLQQLPDDEGVTLPDLLRCVTSRLVFILNTLPDVGQAGAVFEGLNNRGLGLSALENLKAFAIYAVQSFRYNNELPPGISGTAAELNDNFNSAIGEIYHNLDRVGLLDDTAGELLSAFWPVVLKKVRDADLMKGGGAPPHVLDRAQPVDAIRSSLHIHSARRPPQQAALLATLRLLICEKLVPASVYFADARRPMHRGSFRGCDLDPPEQQELRALHQRLVDMQCSAPFLPILLAHRTRYPHLVKEYLSLVRLIERTAFWVYQLAERARGAGRNDLAKLASLFADGEVEFAELLTSIRAFAVSSGNATDTISIEDDVESLADRIDWHLSAQNGSVSAAFAYEWLLSKGVELPRFGRFVQLVEQDKCLRMVRGGGGRLAQGYNLGAGDMAHPGNIVITRRMPEMTPAERGQFNALPYALKRRRLRDMGYNIRLPQNEFRAEHAIQQRRAIMILANSRWAIPESGWILEPTWPAALQNVEQVWNEDGEE